MSHSLSAAGVAPYSDEMVVDLLQSSTYLEVAALTGWSRGKIFNAAKSAGRRKTEARIQERSAERQRRQMDTLEAIVGETISADVLDLLDSLPENGVDLVVTSVPYNVGVKYGQAPSVDAMRHLYYRSWLGMILSETARVMKKNASAFLQVGSTYDDQGRLIPIDSILLNMIDAAGLTLMNRVIWPAAHGLTPTHRLAQRHETALWLCKGGEPTFNPNAARTATKEPGKRYFKGPKLGEISSHPLGSFPSDVWPNDLWNGIPHLGSNNTEKTFHPAQFPVALAKKAVLLWSRPGDLVLDYFAGAGTVEVACVETGRRCISGDIFYEDLRRERIATAKADLLSQLPGVTEQSKAVWQAEARRRDASPMLISDADDRQLVAQFCADVLTPQ